MVVIRVHEISSHLIKKEKREEADYGSPKVVVLETEACLAPDFVFVVDDFVIIGNISVAC